MYDVSKADNHWFPTYHIHHKKKLGIEELIYNPYFLYRFGPFGIVGMQINNILILANHNFVNKEKAEIKVAKIMTKD